MIPGEPAPPASLWSRLIDNILKLEPTSSGLMLCVVVAQTPPPSPTLTTTTTNSPPLPTFFKFIVTVEKNQLNKCGKRDFQHSKVIQASILICSAFYTQQFFVSALQKSDNVWDDIECSEVQRFSSSITYNVYLLSNDREDGCGGFNFLILILPDLKPSLRSEGCKNCWLAVFHQFCVRWAELSCAGPIILLDNNHTHTIQTQPEARKSCWKLHNLATYSTHRWVLPDCVGATMRNFLYLGRIVIM